MKNLFRNVTIPVPIPKAERKLRFLLSNFFVVPKRFYECLKDKLKAFDDFKNKHRKCMK